ncbi:MAG: hypothetical protein J6C84_01705 [Lachnospiraceae bacterium]|nr:hypothetical protein [Lachnospiraceae bacterium]
MTRKGNRLIDFLNKLPWMWMGLLVVMVLILPYFVLGSGCYVQMNDQLDGEVLNYIYRAKYLFSGSDIIPEFMNGMQKSAMTPPAPIGVLLYKFLPPFAAFAAMHIFVILAGYFGMFLLVKYMTGSSLTAMIVSGIFVYLPFYPVYGLSILGQPLLLWALLNLYENKGRGLKYYGCIILYGVSSSLALVGFAWIALLMAAWLILSLKKRSLKTGGIGIAFLVLTGTYLLCNAGLLREMLGIGTSFVSHREEMIVAAMPDWLAYFGEIFLEGGSYGKSYNGVIVALAVLVLLGYPVVKKSNPFKCGGTYQAIAGLFAGAFVISAGAVLWRTPWVAELRMEIGGVVKYFQADRIYWLLPLCWYLILALCMKLLMEETGRLLVFRYGAAFLAAVLLCMAVYPNSTIYHNLRLMIFPDTYKLMNWDDYYAEDVFAQIEEFIGKDKASYRTVSLGITPAAALYNGFYCLDGYSNLYPLEYKHEFREIIARELEKSEGVRVYFDAWGNRCYLFNGETGNYMMIAGNNGGSYQNIELNTEKMYEMGARYLFAAMPIENAEETGLTLARMEPFETLDSYYRIWLYEVTPR